uniref:Mitochondrial n=1 Tax=Durusdinium trenchii TaxID=1381693 RepID=A0ABP0RJV4_9DINO
MQNLKDLAFADSCSLSPKPGKNEWILVRVDFSFLRKTDPVHPDVPLDDELLVALSAKPLVSLELWSFHGDRWMTSEGVVELARASLRDLRKLSLDSFVFQNSEVLQSLSSHCEALQELLLEGTIPCCIGPICGTLRWANLEKLRLASCGLSGKLNCSQLPKLRYLWLFENSGLTSIQGCGQQMVPLNLGLTSCTEIQDFRLDVLTMLDVSSLMLSDAQLAELLGPCARSVRRAVLGGNRISEDDVLLDFLRSARDLHSLSLVGALGDGWGCLNALVEERPGGLGFEGEQSTSISRTKVERRDGRVWEKNLMPTWREKGPEKWS